MYAPIETLIEVESRSSVPVVELPVAVSSHVPASVVPVGGAARSGRENGVNPSPETYPRGPVPPPQPDSRTIANKLTLVIETSKSKVPHSLMSNQNVRGRDGPGRPAERGRLAFDDRWRATRARGCPD